MANDYPGGLFHFDRLRATRRPGTAIHLFRSLTVLFAGPVAGTMRTGATINLPSPLGHHQTSDGECDVGVRNGTELVPMPVKS